MKFSEIAERMKTGLTISAVGHIALLLWAVVTFVTKPLNAQTDSIAWPGRRRARMRGRGSAWP